MNYFLLGVLAPLSLNLLHMIIGIYVVVKLGSVLSLGFTGISFVTKSVVMIFLLWFGVAELGLNYKIFSNTSFLLVCNSRDRSVCYTTLYKRKRK